MNVETSTRLEPAIEPNSCQSILQDILDTLHESEFFSRATKDIHSRFWTRYERVAKDHDEEFLEMHNMNIDGLLIFAGLFSAVNSAFIIDMSSSLNPDPTETTNALLMAILQGMRNTSSLNQPFQVVEPPTSPSPLIFWIQAMAYISLSVSLLAAFGAVMGKQWLAHYKSIRFGRGALDERCRRRQRKFDGLNTWKLGYILDAVPILLQISLLLSAISLTGNVWLLNQTLGVVLVFCVAIGALFYGFTFLAGTIYADCPFQNMLCDISRPLFWGICDIAMIQFRHIRRLMDSSQMIMSIERTLLAVFKLLPVPGFRTKTKHVVVSTDNTMMSRDDTLLIPHEDLIVLEICGSPNAVDISSLTWLIKISTDPEVIVAAAYMIPRLEWPPEFDISTVESWALSNLWTCFDAMDELIPGAEEKAILFLKALIHLTWQCKFGERFGFRTKDFQVLDKDPNQDNAFVLALQGIYSSEDRQGPLPDLASNFDIVWISHMLPYILLRHQMRHTSIPDLCFEVIGQCLVHHSPLVITNGLVSVGLLVGLNIHSGKLYVLDKSASVFDLRRQVFYRISRYVRNSESFDNDLKSMWSNTSRLFLPLLPSLLSRLFNTSFFDNEDLIGWGVTASAYYLKLCEEWDPQEMNYEDNYRKFRLALQNVTQVAQAGVSQEGLIYELQNCHMASQYLELFLQHFMHISGSDDDETLHNILLIIGSMKWSHNNISIPEYLSALTNVLAARPQSVQYAALRALSAIRDQVVECCRNDHLLKGSILSAISNLIQVHDSTTVYCDSAPYFLVNYSWLGKFEQPIFHYLRLVKSFLDEGNAESLCWNQNQTNHYYTILAIMDKSILDSPLRDFEIGPCLAYLLYIISITSHLEHQSQESKSYWQFLVLIPKAWACLSSQSSFMLQNLTCKEEFLHVIPLLTTLTIELVHEVKNNTETEMAIMRRNVEKIEELVGWHSLDMKDTQHLTRLVDIIDDLLF